MKKKINIYKWLAFLIVLIPKASLCLFAYPVSVLSDEVATISGATLLTNLDWSAVVSQAGYYGTGFTALMAPFFWCTDNPVILYRLIGFACTLAQSVTALMAYSILEDFLEIKDKKYLVPASVASAYLVANRGILIFNEHGLILCVWLVVWLMTKLLRKQNNKKERCFYTALISLVLAYSLTLHTRAISLWLAFGITVLLYAWIYHVCIVSLPTAFITGGAGYIAAKAFIEMSQNRLWLAGGGETLRNTTLVADGGIARLLDVDNWQALGSILIGQIHTIGVMTGGLGIIFLVIFVHRLWLGILRKKQIVSSPVEQRIMPVVIFSLAGIAIIILGVSITWLSNVSSALQEGYYNSAYGIKGITYVRYSAPFYGPLLLMCCAYLYLKRDMVLGYIKAGIAAVMTVGGIWLLFIVPFLSHTGQTVGFEFYAPFSFYLLGEEARVRMLLPASVMLFAMAFLLWFLLKKRLEHVWLIILSVILMYSYIFLGITWDLKGMNEGYSFGNAGSEFVYELEEKVDFPDKIYIEDVRKMLNHQTFYEYQLLLSRYQVQTDIPEDSVEEAVVFSNNSYGQYPEWEERGYKYVILDDNEVVFVKGDKLQKQLEEQGVELQ